MIIKSMKSNSFDNFANFATKKRKQLITQIYFSCNPAKISATAINVQMTRNTSEINPITSIKLPP